ncbi:uncharacterized protein LOC132949412 [Metopolophium dirhodum]|uniref:uncharacterized protein LOC132949412 n=1 Tax=Metopolophium dirhodum TaxID=44670 RepID=UPI00298F75D1|nr:uncharacterized protein LOC132949412 [Metopolophium dirhodum]
MNDTPLPPVPVLTRWGTWVHAALYYADYFTKYKKVIEGLAMDDAQSIRKVLDIIEDGTIVNDLTFISTHLAFLVIVIKKLETQNMTLHESISIINEMKEKNNSIPGSKGATLATKLNELSNKN